jgi:hypothetical protein
MAAPPWPKILVEIRPPLMVRRVESPELSRRFAVARVESRKNSWCTSATTPLLLRAAEIMTMQEIRQFTIDDQNSPGGFEHLWKKLERNASKPGGRSLEHLWKTP